MKYETAPAAELDLATREGFANALVSQGCVSQEFIDSGILDKFDFDEESGVDVAKHILIGDGAGGFHHLRTARELELEKNTAASLLVHPRDFQPDLNLTGLTETEILDMVRSPGEHNETPRRKPSESRKKQKVQENGVYRPEFIMIDGVPKREQEGEGRLEASVMFPEDWSAEDVLSAAVIAAERGTPVDSAEDREKRNSIRMEYTDELSGVTVHTVVSTQTGKIITAYPIRSNKTQH